MFFDSGECVSSGCTNADDRDNTTIRMSARAERVETTGDLLVTGNLATLCLNEGGVPSFSGTVVTCVTYLSFETMIPSSWDINDFGIYRNKALFGVAPSLLAGPGIFNGNAYPNTVAATNGIRTVAAAVDCITVGVAAALRWSFRRTQGGPCRFDTEYQINYCCPGGKAADNAEYFDSNDLQLNEDAIVKDVFCPTTFLRRATPTPTPTSTPTPTPTPIDTPTPTPAP